MSRLEAHYDAIVETHGYGAIDFDLGDLPESYLRRRFAAVDGRDAVSNALDRETMVTTGVGVNGPPHLGTVGQILTAIRLQEAGLPVQFVIADLEPYHGGGDLDELRRRAARFRRFILDLGFDPDRGWLRTQEEAREVMHTAHLLARYYTPDAGEYWPESEQTAWETAVSEMYEAADSDDGGPTSEMGGHHSGMLHLADFLHPLVKEGYDQVIVALGIDEHALTAGTRRFAADAGVEGTIAGLHARMITGVGDHPKMGRSAPGSDISLDMPAEEIRAAILDPENDADRPADSMVFQATCLASEYSAPELDRLEELCAGGDEAWTAAKREYTEYALDLADRWKRTAETGLTGSADGDDRQGHVAKDDGPDGTDRPGGDQPLGGG